MDHTAWNLDYLRTYVNERVNDKFVTGEKKDLEIEM